MAEPMAHRLAGRYEVRSLIGRGGMAEVHLGFDTRLSRVVAIKMLTIACCAAIWRRTRSSRRASVAKHSRQRR